MEKREKTKYRLTEEQVAEVNHRLAAFREGGRYATDEQVAALWEREVGVATPLRPKNTGDLQGRKSAKYNIRPCNRDKKGNRYETIKNSEKNRKEQREKQERTALLAATKKPADEQRRATVAQIRD